MTVVTLRNGTVPSVKDSASVDLDRDVGRVRDDVEHRRTLLRLGYQGLDLVGRGVGVDLVADLDLTEPVADLGVDPEDAPDVVAAW